MLLLLYCCWVVVFSDLHFPKWGCEITDFHLIFSEVSCNLWISAKSTSKIWDVRSLNSENISSHHWSICQQPGAYTDCCQQIDTTTDNRQQTTDNRQHQQTTSTDNINRQHQQTTSTDNRQQTTNNRQQTTDNRQQTTAAWRHACPGERLKSTQPHELA